MHTRVRLVLTVLSLATLMVASPLVSRADSYGAAEWVEGVLLLAWGDPIPGAAPQSPISASLYRPNGIDLLLELTPDMLAAVGGPAPAYGRLVRILVPFDASGSGDGLTRPLEIQAVGGDASAPDAVTGSQPWVSIMCKFSNVPTEPEDLGFFLGMYANTWPALDDYWRHQSYDTINVVGSNAVGWFTLPQTQAYYEGLSSGGNYTAMLGALYDDCTAAAGGSVNLNNYVGVNLMFNDTFGPYAWGGGWGGRRVTWEPPWGWGNIAVMGHEMGHGFGLPHSNNADGDSNPYDNPWDVMSDSWGYALGNGTYGTVGKHTISYHKDSLGWILPGRKAEVTSSGSYWFDVDHLTHASTSNLHMVKVQIPGTSRYYTVEVRDRVGYDGNLPGFAVILHEVVPGRTEPAWLVDADDPNNGADAGAMWIPGECFDDSPNGIQICVDSVLTEGYRVRVFYGDWYVIFQNGFDSGDAGAWSSVVP